MIIQCIWIQKREREKKSKQQHQLFENGCGPNHKYNIIGRIKDNKQKATDWIDRMSMVRLWLSLYDMAVNANANKMRQ